MRLDSSGAEPETLVGRWLFATATRQDAASISRLAGRLNGGRAGLNLDEPAVVSASCHLALADLEERAHGGTWRLLQLLQDHGGSDQLLSPDIARATAAATLREPIPPIEGVLPERAFSVQGVLFAGACRALALTDPEIKALVRRGEVLAASRGFNPPLAPSGAAND